MSRVCESSFEKLKIIDQEHRSKTFLVQKKDDEKYFSMKICKISKRDENELDDVLFERRILQNMRHSFINKLHFSFRSSDRKKYFFVTTYLSGGELLRRLFDLKRLSESSSRFYAAELFLVLDHMHKNNVILDNLGLENIILGNDGHISLRNFLYARDITKPKGRCLTFDGYPTYYAPGSFPIPFIDNKFSQLSSPEILLKTSTEEDLKEYWTSTDWWTFGIVVYEMMTGVPPFYTQDVTEMYQKILEAEVKFDLRVQMSENAKDLIRKLLTKNPKRRLGCLDSSEIKNHPFFAEIDWERLEKKKIRPEYIPNLDGENDTTFIEEEFLKMPIEDTTPDYAPDDIGAFSGFSFVGFEYNNGTSPNFNQPKKKEKKKVLLKETVEIKDDDNDEIYSDDDEFYYSWEDEKREKRKKEQSFIDEQERVCFLKERFFKTTSGNGSIFTLKLGIVSRFSIVKILL